MSGRKKGLFLVLNSPIRRFHSRDSTYGGIGESNARSVFNRLIDGIRIVVNVSLSAKEIDYFADVMENILKKGFRI
jgi:hypothetical protein